MISRPLVAAVLSLCGLAAVACGEPTAASSVADARSPRGPVAAHPADPSLDARAEPSAQSLATSPSAAQGRPQGASWRASTESRGSSADKPLAGKVVLIDPGHNGGNWRNFQKINKPVNVLTKRKACDTTGTTTNDGYTEAAFAWDVSVRLRKLLRQRGATVKLTRTDNTGWGPCITERAAIGNRIKADAAISIHADGAPSSARGFHIIVPKKINGPVDPVVNPSRRLGRTIRDAFRRWTGLPYSNYLGKNGLVARDDLGGLNLSKVPKILLECGNMRNPHDAAKFKDPRFRQRIAKALAQGFEDYLTATS